MTGFSPQLYQPQEIGKSLIEVGVDLIQSEGRCVLSRWFHSTQDVDLFIWQDDRNNIIKQQISMFGQVVEWNIVEGLKTGMIVEESDSDSDQKVKGSELIRYDQSPQGSSLKVSIEVLQHVKGLSASDLQCLLHNFRTGEHMGSLDPRVLVERFGGRDSGLLLEKSILASLVHRLSRFFKKAG